MNLDEIEKKCFILALFIRDDGERFLLGSRMFEFVDSQLHFSGNNYQNDIVEVQGNDGVMLAGQVRRGSSQAFDGYIGDSSVDRSTIEQYRRSFFQFFRKNHYYKVVYIFTDGTAIQRRQGFIVEAPEVKELYQLFPQYHISMNFEDINYYNYEEDSEGQEIYGESATLKVITSATGGLIWEAASETTISGEGSNFTLQDTIEDNVLESVTIKGDTTQQTYSGKNLLKVYQTSGTISDHGVTFTMQNDGSILIDGTSNGNIWLEFCGSFAATTSTKTTPVVNLDSSKTYILSSTIRSGTYEPNGSNAGMTMQYNYPNQETAVWNLNGGSATFSGANGVYRVWLRIYSGNAFNNCILQPQIESGSQATSFEPYVGGTPAPNPDYPQTVNTVTGRQVVTISDGDSQSQSYEVNLGKNLFNLENSLDNYFVTVGTGTQVYTNNDKTFVTATFENNKVTFSNYQTTGWRWLSKTVNLEKNTTYTISGNIESSMRVVGFDSLASGSNGTLIQEFVPSANKYPPGTFDSGSYKYIVISLYPNEVSGKSFEDIQIEKGSTVTTYAPYYTPIELCKIGTYQDYIYKSSGNWYVHKAIGKYTFTGSESWNNAGEAGTGYNGYYRNLTGIGIQIASQSPCYMTGFRQKQYSYNVQELCFMVTYAGNGTIIMITKFQNASDLQNYFSNNSNDFYYRLSTPTDTQITNADLIAQLEALLGATTYDGQTVFTVSSPNQLAILNVSVLARTDGGVVWDNYGAEWEEGTGGGPTMIDIESIDNVYPVWELTGPAVNPQISVLNTNTILSYTGTVTASQTLKIDMFNKTATLNGASVIGNVSGDWVYLEPGINRLTYTTSNADAPDSTIWWQEIVG